MTTLYLDWDISYHYWSSHTRDKPKGKRSIGWMKNRLRLFRRRLAVGLFPLGVWYRRSGSGRIHIALEFPEDALSNNTGIVFRTFLLDDPARVYLDIVRWCQGAETNRLFDTKYSKGRIRKAGPWVKWFTLR